LFNIRHFGSSLALLTGLLARLLNVTSDFVTFDLFLEVIFVKDMLYAVLALVSLGIAAFSFWEYVGNANSIFIVLTIVFLLLGVVLGGLFLSGRVNKGDDIHITE